MTSPLLEFDLAAEAARMRREPAWAAGRNARTLMNFDDFRVVLTTMRPRTRISEDTTEGRISIHLVAGHVLLTAAGRTFDLHPGGLVGLDARTPYDVEAIEESVFLATIAWPGP